MKTSFPHRRPHCQGMRSTRKSPRKKKFRERKSNLIFLHIFCNHLLCPPLIQTEPTENEVANFNGANNDTNSDAFANGQVDAFNVEVATATQGEGRNSASSLIARAPEQSIGGQGTTPIPAAA